LTYIFSLLKKKKKFLCNLKKKSGK
jgi:hypothetical protein